MTIGIDIDEVLADLLSQYINFLNHQYKLALTYEVFRGYYIWDDWQDLNIPKNILFENFYKSNFFKQIKPIKESLNIVDQIKKNHSLYAITSRPDNLKRQTFEWINKYVPHTFKEIHFANYLLNQKKSDICKELHVDLMIEDSMDYALDCANNNIQVLLLSYPWNNTTINNPLIYKVKTWDEIRLYLGKYINT